jgi:predicted O-methyltransferase YrrM
LPAIATIKDLLLAYFSRPAGDRVIYRAIRRRRPCRILEIGMGSGRRTRRMLEMALRHQPADQLRYTGIDLFETRPAGSPALSLKEAHRLVKIAPIRAQLVPGDPYSALARTANSLQGLDLVVISADQDPASLTRAWFYFPRMLGADGLVLQEQLDAKSGQITVQPIARETIEASAAPRRRAG